MKKLKTADFLTQKIYRSLLKLQKINGFKSHKMTTNFLFFLLFSIRQRENSIRPNFNLKNDLIMDFVDDAQFYYCGNTLDNYNVDDSDSLKICEKFAVIFLKDN